MTIKSRWKKNKIKEYMKALKEWIVKELRKWSGKSHHNNKDNNRMNKQIISIFKVVLLIMIKPAKKRIIWLY